jgi:hypothetical protein
VAREGGGLLRLSAAHETTLLSQLEEALPVQQHSSQELHSSTGRELAFLTGRPHSYSYRYTERFLLQLSAAQADQALTEVLA